MLSLINYDYQNFRQLSVSQTKSLANSSECNASLTLLKQNAPHYRHDIAVIALNLTKIQHSLNSYSATVSVRSANYSKLSTIQKIAHLIHKLINFLHRTEYKVKVLQKSLPTLFAAVIQARTEVDQTFTDEERKTENDSIAKKLDLVNRVQKQFLQDNPNPAKWDRTAQKVNAYVQNKFQRLNFGINVALPNFYHCTKTCYFDSIVKAKQIDQTDAIMGKGAYISTDIEYIYGPYAFALDANAVNHPAYYFSGRKKDWTTRKKYDSVWVRVQHHIEIKPATVANITVESLNEHSFMARRLRKLQLNIPVITSKTNTCITDLFEKVVPKMKFPTQWTGLFELPPNIQEPLTSVNSLVSGLTS